MFVDLESNSAKKKEESIFYDPISIDQFCFCNNVRNREYDLRYHKTNIYIREEFIFAVYIVFETGWI